MICSLYTNSIATNTLFITFIKLEIQLQIQWANGLISIVFTHLAIRLN